MNLILKGGKFIACNSDKNYISDNDKLLPGCGALIGAIKGCTGKEPDYIVGKPNTYMLQQIAKDNNVTNNEIIVVGDSYDSDIKMAIDFNCNYIDISDTSQWLLQTWIKYIEDHF